MKREFRPVVTPLEDRSLLSAVAGVLQPRHLLSGFSDSVRVAELHVDTRSRSNTGRTLDVPDALVYMPAGLQPGRTYPMVIAFTPDGKLKRTLGDWHAVADRFHWIVYASKQFSDNSANTAPDFDQYGYSIWRSVDAALSAFPVDRSRIVLAGFSGGGFFAEFLDSRVAGLAAALVIDANGLYGHGDDPEIPFPAGTSSGSRRLAAFLYSPTDRRFGMATQADRAFYQQHGWSTLLLSYPGGHVDAPPSQYLRAAAWIAGDAAWQT
jgi:poly(3-hydroxybutyrate) depolymerase